MKIKGKLTAIVLAALMTITSMSATLNLSKTTVNAASYIGLDATKHSQDDIKTYIKNHPYNRDATVYDVEPSPVSYTVGKVSDASLQSDLNYLNIYRYIAGLPEVKLTEDAQNYAQSAALLMAATNHFDHTGFTKPSGMPDAVFSAGATGAANSNIASSSGSQASIIDMYMTEINGDPGFGHRRQILDPTFTETGFGTVGYYSALYVDAYLNEKELISYPAQNQPLEFFSTAYAWTVTIPQAIDYNTVHVKLTSNRGNVWEFSYKGIDDYEYMNIASFNKSSTLIFAPSDILYREGDVYTVEITGIPNPIKYNVNMFYANKIPVESVTMSNYTPYTNAGREVDRCCSVNFTPSNASNKIMLWTSSDESIATVKTYGTSNCSITAIKEGTVTITGTSEDSGQTVSFEFKVLPVPTGIDCIDEITVGVGQSFSISGTPIPSESRCSIVFNSEDSSILAKNYSNNKFEGVSIGTTYIKAYAYNYPDVYKLVKVNVVKAVPLTAIEIEGPESLMIGETGKYNVKFTPSDATLQLVTWSSSYRMTSNGNGSFTAPDTPGEYTIYAKSQADSSISASMKVKVLKKQDKPDAPVLKSATNTSLSVEYTSGDYYAEYSLDGVNWQGNTIFNNLKPNTTYKIYKRFAEHYCYLASDISEPATFKTTNTITDISINTERAYIGVGDKVQFTAEITPSNADNPNVVWSVSNTDYASIDSATGLLTAKTEGIVTVYASSDDGRVRRGYTVYILTKQAPPEAPVIDSVSTDSFTIKNSNIFAGIEYSIDGKTWQSSLTFTGLKPNTTYKVYARYKESYYYVASDASKPTEVTTAAVATPTPESSKPTTAPTKVPTAAPTDSPVNKPTSAPTTPTNKPTNKPTAAPDQPNQPNQPANPANPTTAPGITDSPSDSSPVATPTATPNGKPTSSPNGPTSAPTNAPSGKPENNPTDVPSENIGNIGMSSFAERLYTTCLGRDSEPEGKAYWIEQLKIGTTGASIAEGFFFSPELTNQNLSDREFITRLYRTFMDREPAEDEIGYWAYVMISGNDRKFVFDGFVNSPEWANICLSYGIMSGGLASPTYEKQASIEVVAFAERLYTTCLGREAEEAGLKYWSQELANLRQTGRVAAQGFFFSPEFVGMKLDDEEYVTRLYRTFMGREPEAAGFEFWISEMKAGKDRQYVFNGFASAPEFADLCAKAGIIA